MVDAIFLLRAMDGIGEQELLLTGDFLGMGEQTRRSERKLWRAVLIAAALALLLAACGYFAFRATMSYHDLHPDDDNSYYLNIEERDKSASYHLDLNFGTCAMALHFETEETGFAHAFRLQEGAPIPPEWKFGGYTMRSFFNSFGSDGGRQEAQQRPLEQCLREAGMTEEEAQEWYFSATFSWDGLPDRPAMRIELFDGPQLHDLDLIIGWPEGTATVVREETQGSVQLLETLVDVKFSEEHREKIKYLCLFDTERQVLLVMAAADEAMDFPAMEALADSIEIRQTGFSYACDRSGQNFSVLGLAYG